MLIKFPGTLAFVIFYISMSHKLFLRRYISENRANHQQLAEKMSVNNTFAERAASEELSGTIDPEPEIELLPMRKKEVRRFRTEGMDYKVKIKLPDTMPKNLIRYFEKSFEQITTRVLDNIPEHDMIGLVFSWDSLEHPAYFPFGLKKDFSVKQFLEKLDGILQSNAKLSLDEPITVSVTRVEMPQGEGQRKGISNRNEPDIRKWLKSKRCIITIRNTDQLCLGRALAVAIGRIDWKKGKISKSQYHHIRNHGTVKQKKEASRLFTRAKVAPGPCGIPEVMKFQQYLKEYQITVRSVPSAGGVIYEGPKAPDEIVLLYHENHFDVITSIPAFFGRNYYCKECKRAYNDPEKHKCKNICKCCLKGNCKISKWILCVDCNRWMKNKKCYDNHKRLKRSVTLVNKKSKEKVKHPSMSVCDKLRICEQCTLPITFPAPHTCGQRECKICKCMRPIEHLCYVPVIEKEQYVRGEIQANKCIDGDDSTDDVSDENAVKGLNVEDTYHFIWYDLETTQDSPIEGKDGWYQHQTNLTVAQTSCNNCSRHFEQKHGCRTCSKKVFEGDESIKEFVDWLLEQDGAIAVGHNASAFDSVLVTREVTSRGFILKNVILRGQKILSCEIPCGQFGIKLIDSMQFVSGPLSNFPRVFDLTELKKGWFPHLFNKNENRSYDGAMPDMKYYDPDSMKPDVRSQFLKWYDAHKGDHFNMEKEILQYCESDVKILCEGMMKFRKIFFDLTEVDPLRKCVTIASAAMRTFQQNYLKRDEIGVIPRNGYANQNRQSRIGLLWLKWWAHSHGDVDIQHNGNGREYKIGKYLTDGYHKESNTVLEFMGCFIHSCPKCHDLEKLNPLTKRLRKTEYEQTMKRLQDIKGLGYNIELIWECEFRRQMEDDELLQSFLARQRLSTPLRPVDSLFGGRTNALRLYYDCLPDEEISVKDFISLYPFANRDGKYPIHHPKIITENFDDLSQYFGFIKCRVLPPSDLFLPVLPYRTNGKLTFPLCKPCADNALDTCHHTDEERAWDGTFVSVELMKAIEKGYKVVHTYEVWHWEETSQYNPETKTGGIFTEYIKTFLKIKQESSGWPEWCKTPEDMDQYLMEYLMREGIKLDPDKIMKTPLRAIAKLLLNSLWGKFAQNPDMTKTEYINSYEGLVKLLFDELIEVRNLFIINDQVAMIQFKPKDPTGLSTENIALASFTTAHARLRLYDAMDAVAKEDKNRILYHDTDSIFFVKRAGLYDPPCGSFLGDLSDEYPGKKITKFYSGGPKNYMYMFSDGSQVTKVKGISLNFKNSQIITPSLIQDMVQAADGRRIRIDNQRKIARSREHGIVTKPEHKHYSMVYNKRILHEDGTTSPFGYKNQKRDSPMEC